MSYLHCRLDERIFFTKEALIGIVIMGPIRFYKLKMLYKTNEAIVFI